MKDLENDEVDWKGSEEREVLAAIKSMNGDKATDPNVFSLTFAPSWLRYCERRHHTCFSSLHKQVTFKKFLNATFIALILKGPPM